MSRSWFEGVHYDGLTMPAGSAEDRVLDSLEPEPENPPSRREVDDSDDELPLKRRKIGDIETVTFGDLVDFVAGLASQQPTEASQQVQQDIAALRDRIAQQDQRITELQNLQEKNADDIKEPTTRLDSHCDKT